MKDLEHVMESRRHLVEIGRSQRIAIIQKSAFVDNNASETIFQMVNNMSRARDRLTAPCLLVTGGGGAGKTAIINQFKDRIDNSKGLVYVSMAEDATIKSLKNFRFELAKALGIPVEDSRVDWSKIDLPKEISKVIKLRNYWGVVIDEFHEALLRNKLEQRTTMSVLKRLSDAEYGLSLIAFGTSAASAALSSNKEFQRRFYKYELPLWVESDDFRTFLFGLEELLPLKEPSRLYEENMLKLILLASQGEMDRVVELVQHAAVYALKSGKEHIDEKCITDTIANPWLY
jgi:hypothetical protein